MSLFDHLKKNQDIKPEAIAVEPLPIPETTAPVVAFTDAQQPVLADVQTPDITTPTVAPAVAPITPVSGNAEAQSGGKRFSVGIDLGTTHCVLSYANIDNIDPLDFSQQVMGIPQLTSPGVVEDKLQLPSFLYQAHAAELAEGSSACLLYTSPSPRDRQKSRMPSSA